MESIRLKSLQREIILPLWRNDFNTDDIACIKDQLHKAFFSSNLNDYKAEAAIMFAEWWKNHYTGNTPSKADVMDFIGLPEYATKDIYDAAKAFLSMYNIPLIRQKYTLYFRTLLYQGGLPLNFIIYNDNNYSSFINFLQELCEEINGKVIDWDDVTIFDYLGCKDSLPSSFRTEEIYGLSLQLIRAIIQDREDLLPYNDISSEKFRKLTEKIRECIQNNRQKKTYKPLSLQWEIKINDNGGSLYYHLDNVRHIPHNIAEDMVDCRQFTIQLGDKRVATYQRGKDDFYRITSETVNCRWKGEAFIEVCALISYNESRFLNIIDNCPPDFKCPTVFKKDGNSYVQRKGESPEGKIVVFKEGEWYCNEHSDFPLIIGALNLRYIPFQGSITLVNSITGTQQEYTNTYSPFSIEFITEELSWLDSADYRIITRCPHVRVFNEDGGVIDKDDYKTFYSQNSYCGWTRFRNSTVLPKGLIYIKTTLPDKQERIHAFYNIGNLDFEIDNIDKDRTIISVPQDWGRVEILSQDNLNISKDSDTSWSISKSPALTNYSHIISFEVFVSGSPSVRINIPTPFTSFCIKRISSNEIIRRSDIISAMNLSDYIIVERGHHKPKMTLSFPSLDKDISSAITIPIRSRITPLSDIRDAIESIFNLYEDVSRPLILRIDGQEYHVRRFSLDSRYDEGNVFIYNNSDDEYHGNILCCSFQSQNYSSFPVIEQLSNCANNRFKLPDGESMCNVVFSDRNDLNRIIPTTYGASQTPVREWNSVLEVENVTDSTIWNRVNKVFEIAVGYHLPFRTFNELNAVSSNPYLMAKFILSLFIDDKVDTLFASLQRFENELGTCIQWIRFEQWQKALDDMNILPERLQIKVLGEFSSFCQNLLSVSGAGKIKNAIFNPTGTVISHLTHQDLQDIRQVSGALVEQGSQLPTYKINLTRSNYYNMGATIYAPQRTLINGIISILEYLTNKEDSLWAHSEDSRRRVINFYRTEFSSIYSFITDKIIH